MNNKSIKANVQSNQHYFKNLINSRPKTINKLINCDSFEAVYTISNKDDETIIYVGETSNMVGRMKDHLSGTSFSEKLNVSKNKLKWYKIRYRRMKNQRERKLFESYVIGTLKPKYNF